MDADITRIEMGEPSRAIPTKSGRWDWFSNVENICFPMTMYCRPLRIFVGLMLFTWISVLKTGRTGKVSSYSSTTVVIAIVNKNKRPQTRHNASHPSFVAWQQTAYGAHRAQPDKNPRHWDWDRYLGDRCWRVSCYQGFHLWFYPEKDSCWNQKNSRYPGAEVIGTDLSPIQPGWYAYIRIHGVTMALDGLCAYWILLGSHQMYTFRSMTPRVNGHLRKTRLILSIFGIWVVLSETGVLL